MKVETRLRRCLSFAFLVVSLSTFAAGRAHAFCQPGDVQACFVNGQPGEKVCGSNGIYGPCTPTVPPAPPVPAAPTISARSETSLTVRWSDSTAWSSASYQLQVQPEGTSSWTAVTAITTNPFQITHNGRVKDTRYCYRVEVSASTGVRQSGSTCRVTTDGTTRAAGRLQVEFHTGDVDDAGTDDDILVSLSETAGSTPMNFTWVDYGRDDFERNDRFTYDLNLDQIPLLSDFNRVRISKYGTDGWCLADYRILVNGVPVFSESFAGLPGGCLWIDEDDNHSHTHEVTHAAIRANPLWSAYVEPVRVDVDFSALPLVTARLRIPREETERRLEGLIGHAIHGTEGHWGDRLGRAHVEADPGVTADRVAMDLDLEADVPYWFDPELDIDFDLHYDPACSADQTKALLNVTTENLQANVDFNWFTDFLQLLILPPCTVGGCVTRIEDYIAQQIEAAFQPIMQSQSQPLPPQARCLSAEAVVDQDANVDLVFHLEATQPNPTPTPTPVPTPRPTPTPRPSPTPPPDPCLSAPAAPGLAPIRHCP